MIADWCIEGRSDGRIDIRAHGKLEATLKYRGTDAYPVRVAQSGGVKALPSIPEEAGMELVAHFGRVKVIVMVEEVQG